VGARDLRRRYGSFVICALLVATVGACGGDDDESSDGDAAGGGDAGVDLTMWTRAGTEAQSEALVEAYNASHDNQVELTVYPNEEYPAKIASAAGADALPDIFTSDVVFAPNYVDQNLWQDVSEQFEELEFHEDVAPSHVSAASVDDAVYAVPHTIDASVMFFNKALYTQAGLDPEAPPTTLEEFAEHARAIRQAAGGDTYGTYFGGNCGGCLVFTFWPSVWADGNEVMNEDGTESTIEEATGVFEIYKALYDEGVASPGSRDEGGPTWLGALQTGKVGIAPGPSAWLQLLDEEGLDIGVSPIPGVEGGSSTFVGGDVAGVSATTGDTEAAWDFLSWTLSEEAQVEVLAKNGDVISRIDLADNQYASEDERILTINEVVGRGVTPFALRFNESYNDPQSPWVETLRGALFGDDPAGALEGGAAAITESLNS
jgi:multiple sugar transport system substrate-binding protein